MPSKQQFVEPTPEQRLAQKKEDAKKEISASVREGRKELNDRDRKSRFKQLQIQLETKEFQNSITRELKNRSDQNKKVASLLNSEGFDQIVENELKKIAIWQKNKPIHELVSDIKIIKDVASRLLSEYNAGDQPEDNFDGSANTERQSEHINYEDMEPNELSRALNSKEVINQSIDNYKQAVNVVDIKRINELQSQLYTQLNIATILYRKLNRYKTKPDKLVQYINGLREKMIAIRESFDPRYSGPIFKEMAESINIETMLDNMSVQVDLITEKGMDDYSVLEKQYQGLSDELNKIRNEINNNPSSGDYNNQINTLNEKMEKLGNLL